jgi:hypothetical protein
MPVTLNEKLIAYLTLFSGLAISLVAEFYSIIGFTAIFAAAQIPVIIMGIVLGVGKIAATLWLKQNWKIAHWLVRTYLLTAIAVLMGVTSMGIFGFLSKAHSDQSLVSGDVQSKIAIYDEKIKTARENIDANRKALKQMDEAVDQVMARSSSETGADKAVGLRRSQQKERVRLQSEIVAEQKTIASLNEERAPIAADVRKVEAEVGPIKYIAQFVYGESDKDLLEKAVTWVIIILIAVFDPLAVILLLASQISFQNFRDRRTLTEPFELGPNEYIPDPEEEAFYKKSNTVGDSPRGTTEVVDPKPPTVTEQQETTEGDSPEKESDVVSTATVTESILAQHPYLLEPFVSFKDLQPMVYKPEPVEPKEEVKEYLVDATLIDALEGTVNRLQQENDELRLIVKAKKLSEDIKEHGYTSDNQGEVRVAGNIYTQEEFKQLNDYVQNEEQNQSSLWNQISGTRISEEEYIEQASKKKE